MAGGSSTTGGIQAAGGLVRTGGKANNNAETGGTAFDRWHQQQDWDRRHWIGGIGTGGKGSGGAGAGGSAVGGGRSGGGGSGGNATGAWERWQGNRWNQLWRNGVGRHCHRRNRDRRHCHRRTATGGKSTGGTANRRQVHRRTATGGSASGSTFSQCRFHFGTIDSKAKSAGTAMISQLDFFTPGWMLGGSFDQTYVCTEGNPGGALANQVPVVVAYLAAGITKRNHSLCDCNVSGCSGGNLCTYGSQYIAQDWTTILNAYRSYSQGYASCYGTTRPIVFEMEPDWYQYTYTSQTQPGRRRRPAHVWPSWSRRSEPTCPTPASPGRLALGRTEQWRRQRGAVVLELQPEPVHLRQYRRRRHQRPTPPRSARANNMTWAGLNQVTGKPILADTGYGATASRRVTTRTGTWWRTSTHASPTA